MINDLRLLQGLLRGVVGYGQLISICESSNPKYDEAIAAIKFIKENANLTTYQAVQCENFLNNYTSLPITEDLKISGKTIKPPKSKGGKEDGMILS